MFRELMYKWFGLEATPCEACEILREQLHKSEAERVDLLHRLLDKPQPEPVAAPPEDLKPITPQFVPWRVRQQMMEQEDRKQAELIRKKNEELEKELGVNNATV